MDAGVVDHRVDAAERVDRGLDNACRRTLVGDGRVTRNCITACLADFTHDVISRGGRRTRAVDADAIVGDDDASSLGGQLQCVTTADTAAGSRHDDHTVVEAQLRHDQVGTSKRIGTDVGDRKT